MVSTALQKSVKLINYLSESLKITILISIALFASLCRQGLGTRKEGLSRQRFPSPRYAVVMFLYTVWDSHGAFYFCLRFLCFEWLIKKFELVQKSHVRRALRFWCQGPAGLKRSKKGHGDENAKYTEMVLKGVKI